MDSRLEGDSRLAEVAEGSQGSQLLGAVVGNQLLGAVGDSHLLGAVGDSQLLGAAVGSQAVGAVEDSLAVEGSQLEGAAGDNLGGEREILISPPSTFSSSTVFTVSEEKSGGDGRGGPWPSEKEVQQEVEEVE